MISIHIYGKPVAWKRPAHKVVNGRAIVFDSQKEDKEKARWQIRSFYSSDILISCPVAIKMNFFFSVPASDSKVRRREKLIGAYNHINKPDVDNLLKFYLDCLSGYVLVDDCIVYSILGCKHYSESEYVKIDIDPLHNYHEQENSTLLEDLGLDPNFLDERKDDDFS